MDKPLEARKILMLLDNNFVSDTRVEKEIEALRSAGAEITLACLRDSTLPEKESRLQIRILRCIGPLYNAPLRKGYRQFIREIAQDLSKLDFDTLHCHDFYVLRIGVEIKRQRPEIKLVYDAHEYLAGWPFYKNSKGLNKWKGLLVWRKLVQMERLDISHADQVITITDEIAMRLAVFAKKAPTVIGNFPARVALKPNPDYFRTLFHLQAHTKILVHSGTIYQDDLFLNAVFNSLCNQNDFALVFVGNRPRFDELKERVSAHVEWKKHIFFHAYPENQQETIRLLSHADAGWLHVEDRWEAHRIGFSNRFVEYLAAQIPVIASPQLFTRKMHEAYPCCTFYTTDQFSSFCTALENLKLHHAELKSGAQEASLHLNWESEAQKLIKEYIR